jgi:hypothetical protein
MPRKHLQDKAVDFLTRVARGEVDEAYRRHVGPGFRHHNLWFPGDAVNENGMV